MDVLTVRGLTRRFGPLVVLDDVSFSIPPGHITGVLGPNGSGKTTLLRCVVGADPPDTGQVLLEGRPMDETDASVRATVAAALDDMDFFPDLSAVEHLELLAFAHGIGAVGGGAGAGAAGGVSGSGGTGGSSSAADVVAEVMTELGLDEARDQLPATLSSGQRRRLALASCFVRPRRLLVMDEPEQRLDVRGREWLARRLLREREKGTAVLFSSHDPGLVDRVADSRIELGA